MYFVCKKGYLLSNQEFDAFIICSEHAHTKNVSDEVEVKR